MSLLRCLLIHAKSTNNSYVYFIINNINIISNLFCNGLCDKNCENIERQQRKEYCKCNFCFIFSKYRRTDDNVKRFREIFHLKKENKESEQMHPASCLAWNVGGQWRLSYVVQISKLGIVLKDQFVLPMNSIETKLVLDLLLIWIGYHIQSGQILCRHPLHFYWGYICASNAIKNQILSNI